jgi:hypothetical protein
MDTGKIKALATGARDELRRDIEGRLDAILAEGSAVRLSDPNAVGELEAAINEKGRDHVIDSAAYTWFNRLCALRFMDANGYTTTPVVTPREGSTQPAVLADAAQGIYDPEYGFDRMVRDRVSALLLGSVSSANATEDAYDALLRAVCRHYAGPMGYLFSEESASSLLIPSGLLAEGSILHRIVDDMDKEACSSVEVLGWLYQFYIAERKDEVFAGFKAKGKANKKAGPDEIGPATQLFTPEYIVRFLTQNSLGRLWMLNNPGSGLVKHMEYFIAPKDDESHIEVADVEEIRVLDPACGSGHILVYAFDLLFEMYEEEGYSPENIPTMILRNNLKGLEIDARAAEIAKFALEMKAREHDSHFFDRDIDADITVLVPVKFEVQELSQTLKAFKKRNRLLNAIEHMSEAGSLYVPDSDDAAVIRKELERLGDPHEDSIFAQSLRRKLQIMLADVEALSGTYHCVIANPPYMGNSNMGSWLSSWVKSNYPDEKGDLCTCFVKRGLCMTKSGGYTAEITKQSWMFLDSYEDMRKGIIENYGILTMAHLGTRAFDAIGGEVVSTVATVFWNNHWNDNGTYVRLVDCSGEDEKSKALKESAFNSRGSRRYNASSENFVKLPGWPIAYWASNRVIEVFSEAPQIEESIHLCQGLTTSDNKLFVRCWWEPSLDDEKMDSVDLADASNSNRKWFPFNKGGSFRRWYGNRELIVNYYNDGEAIKKLVLQKYPYLKTPDFVVKNQATYFSECLTWSALSNDFSIRWVQAGSICADKGQGAFGNHDSLVYAAGFLNSSIASHLLSFISPTLDFNCGYMREIPFILSQEDIQRVNGIVDKNISIARYDWDAFETSWDFDSHPLVHYGESLIEGQYAHWQMECQSRFEELKSNEEELNRIFARIYHMEGEVPIEVPDDKVSVRRADLVRDVKSLISYGVGCIFGRYSLDMHGLVLADQGATVAEYLEQVPNPRLMPDGDNILPITETAWFDDDIVDSFYRFLVAAYGEETLGENVEFIESALGCDLRTYFVKQFYADHLKTYQKRPIYWLFQSPKKSFSCLVYMHRYDESTVGEILTGYLRPLQGKFRARIDLLEKERTAKGEKEANRLRAQVQELEEWERNVIYHLAHAHVHIDLDDGVKVNYNKFPHALAKVPGLSDWK